MHTCMYIQTQSKAYTVCLNSGWMVWIFPCMLFQIGLFVHITWLQLFNHNGITVRAVCIQTWELYMCENSMCFNIVHNISHKSVLFIIFITKWLKYYSRVDFSYNLLLTLSFFYHTRESKINTSTAKRFNETSECPLRH